MGCFTALAPEDMGMQLPQTPTAAGSNIDHPRSSVYHMTSCTYLPKHDLFRRKSHIYARQVPNPYAPSVLQTLVCSLHSLPHPPICTASPLMHAGAISKA